MRVVLRPPGEPGQLTACHQNDLTPMRLHEFALLLVSDHDVAEVACRAGRKLVGLNAADDTAADRRGLSHRAPDQPLARLPIEAHSPLGGVHRLGDAEPAAPDVAAEGQRPLPVDRGGRNRTRIGERVGDHVDGGVREA